MQADKLASLFAAWIENTTETNKQSSITSAVTRKRWKRVLLISTNYSLSLLLNQKLWLAFTIVDLSKQAKTIKHGSKSVGLGKSLVN